MLAALQRVYWGKEDQRWHQQVSHSSGKRNDCCLGCRADDEDGKKRSDLLYTLEGESSADTWRWIDCRNTGEADAKEDHQPLVLWSLEDGVVEVKKAAGGVDWAVAGANFILDKINQTLLNHWLQGCGGQRRGLS